MILTDTSIQPSSAKNEPLSLKREPTFFPDSAYRAIYVVALLFAMIGWMRLLLNGAQWLLGL
jgi:hypothetical protein